ncbi:hypothetical protein [Microbacterium sp. HJ5]
MADSTATRRTIAWAVAALTAGVLLVYLLWIGWLSTMATEGDVPPVSSIPLPAGSEVIGEELSCSSGGCTAVIEVLPPDGMSPAELAAALGAAPRLEIPGNLLDPRTINVRASAGEETLTLLADYFSHQYTP